MHFKHCGTQHKRKIKSPRLCTMFHDIERHSGIPPRRTDSINEVCQASMWWWKWNRGLHQKGVWTAIHLFILQKCKSRQIWVYIEEIELTEVTWKWTVPKNHHRGKNLLSNHNFDTTRLQNIKNQIHNKINNKMMENWKTMNPRHFHLPNWKENDTDVVKQGTNPQTVDKRRRFLMTNGQLIKPSHKSKQKMMTSQLWEQCQQIDQNKV